MTNYKMTLQPNKNENLWIQPYKLIRPSINQKLLARERLLTLLDQCESVPLACVFSPAGFGKSALVVDWIQQRQHQHGWYSLDINDNDPNYFASHLIYAIHAASNGGCPRSIALVEQQEYANLHSLLSKAMIEVAQTGQGFFMVLDDVHTVTNPVIVQALRHWLRLLPPQIHVILCCQNEPPISLSAFRVKGQLIEISADQLAFTEQETQEFLQKNVVFNVEASLTKELTQKIGGWPAALQLMTHCANSAEDLIDASGRLGQGAFEVDEFLIHEVIGQQPEKIQHFLYDICVFEQFNESLCQAMLNDVNCNALIHELEQRQLFIHRVQGQERWYRFQDILRESLLKQLQTNHPEQFSESQKKAVRAYLQQGLFIEAVQLGLQLKQEDAVLTILSSAGLELYRRGQFSTLVKLFSCVSPDCIKQDNHLTLLYAWVLLATYREGDVLKLFDDKTLAENETVFAEYSVANAQAAINVEAFELAQQLAEQAKVILPTDSFVSHTVVYSVLGQSALCRGELNHALTLLNDAERYAFEHKLVQQRLWSMCLISDVHTACGNLDKALSVQQSAIDMAHDNCIETVLHMEFLYRNRTQLLIEQGDLTQADRLLLKSEGVIEPLGNYGLLNIHVHRGMIALWRGQHEEARKLAFQVSYLLQSYDYHTDWLAHAVEFLMAAELTGILDFEPHFIWRDKHLNCSANNHFYQHYQRVYSVFLYHNGEQEKALSRLQAQTELAEKVGLNLQALKNRLLLNLWKDDAGAQARWVADLPQLKALKPLMSLWLSALFAGNPAERSWPDWNVWFSQPKAEDDHGTHNEQLLSVLNEQYADPNDLVTPKELQVLLLIGAGLNNDEIASSMYIAVSTVKSHIRRLYRKLNISRRAQAIEICRYL